jgi:hypothetical protein
VRVFANIARVATVAAALGVLATGCLSTPSGTLFLSWQLSDHRDCFTAGAAAVELRTTRSLTADALASFRCSDGLAPAGISVDVPGSGTLYVDGRTALGADLYHGELSLTSNPPGTGEPRAVTLYAVAAE